MSKERFEAIYNELKNRIESYKTEELQFPKEHPLTYKLQSNYEEACKIYNGFSEEEKSSYIKKMEYIEQFSPKK